MIQLTNQRVLIHAKLSENNFFTLQFNAHQFNQISEIFDKGFQGFRETLSKEIFLPDNKSLFVLTNHQSKKYNQFESVEEGLEIFNNDCLVYFKLIKEKGQKDNVKLRISNLRQLIQGLQQKIPIIYFDPDSEKYFKISISGQKQLGYVQFKFMCSGNEQTIQQLKKKALDLFFQNFPKIEILVEYDYFTIRNINEEYGINENNELVSFIFQKDSNINLEIHLKGPVDAKQLQNQFGNLFYKFVSIGHDIQYVFHQFYKFVQERGQSLDSQQIIEIENRIIDASVEQCLLINEVNEQKCDTIREFARQAVNFAKKVSKTKLAICSAPYIVGAGILGEFYSNLKFCLEFIDNKRLIIDVSNQIDIISSQVGIVISAISLAAEIGYLIYHRKKFTNVVFYSRMCAAVVKQVTSFFAFKFGIIAVATVVSGAPTLIVSIIGVLLGVGLAFISQYLFEKILNYFCGSDKQIATDFNFLNDHDKNKCYFSALKDIDCDETTTTSEIKKLRLKRLKDLHPDKQNDQNKNDEFIKQYVAFEIVLSFRESQEQEKK